MQLAPPGSKHILELPESPPGSERGALLINHVGTIHASVLFALAEAASGEFLLRQLGELREEGFAVQRTSTVKFRKPAAPHGGLRASARFADTDASQLSAALASRGRASVAILAEVADAQGVLTMTGQFDWFLQQQGDEG